MEASKGSTPDVLDQPDPHEHPLLVPCLEPEKSAPVFQAGLPSKHHSLRVLDEPSTSNHLLARTLYTPNSIREARLPTPTPHEAQELQTVDGAMLEAAAQPNQNKFR